MRKGPSLFIAFKTRNTLSPQPLRIFRYSSSHTSNIPDYYGVLGVARNATQSEIKNSFLELSKKYHPDLNLSTAKQATERFIEVKEAYNQLSDPTARSAYNSKLDNFFSTPNFQSDFFHRNSEPQYPSPVEVPKFVKWLDNMFPTATLKESRSETNMKHLKVILFMMGLCFLWYSIKNWQIRKLKSGLSKVLERESEKNQEYLQTVKNRASTRSNFDHLIELKNKSDMRAAKNAVSNSEK